MRDVNCWSPKRESGIAWSEPLVYQKRFRLNEKGFWQQPVKIGLKRFGLSITLMTLASVIAPTPRITSHI
jgi:hypothetical protein